MNKTLHTWLRLFRAPNLFTVPGDPLAGYLLASGGAVSGRVFLGIGASLCLYAGGLLLNDLCDLEVDRRERPNRPLPGGDMGVGTVRLAAFLLGVAGLGCCAAAGAATAAVGVGLLLCVVLYDAGVKNFALIGPVNMGLCRGLSVLAGSTAALGAKGVELGAPAAILITTLHRRGDPSGTRRDGGKTICSYTLASVPVARRGRSPA